MFVKPLLWCAGVEDRKSRSKSWWGSAGNRSESGSSVVLEISESLPVSIGWIGWSSKYLKISE